MSRLLAQAVSFINMISFQKGWLMYNWTLFSCTEAFDWSSPILWFSKSATWPMTWNTDARLKWWCSLGFHHNVHPIIDASFQIRFAALVVNLKGLKIKWRVSLKIPEELLHGRGILSALHMGNQGMLLFESSLFSSSSGCISARALHFLRLQPTTSAILRNP